MSNPQNPSPTGDPKEKGSDNDPKVPNPGKPDNDPDQTPTREINDPPVADPNQEPGKTQKPGFK